ncbi:MAG: TnsA endonuclease C-terminal domain-containing protein [Clostridia bacterium]
MSKYDLSWNENKMKRYIDEGRGQGRGPDYKPWITVRDFPSDGVSSRQPGWKSNRVYHFLSNHELRYFFLLEWSDIIVDIREQYPMEQERTLRIAKDAGIKHPTNRESKFPYVMTTDFIITVNISGKQKDIVRTVKPFKDLEKRSVIEHFEIERRYWEELNIDWGIVTENEIPLTFVKNIDWVYFDYRLEPTHELRVEELLYLGELLKDRLCNVEKKIVQVTKEFDKEMNIESGTGLTLFKHLVARKEISMDMMSKLCVMSSTTDITNIIRKNSKVMSV